MRHLSLLAAAAVAAATPLPAQPNAPVPAAPDYSNDSDWLCLPGRSDVCSTPLATTALNPNGYGSTGQSSVANNPPLDCFYVYPTVSRDQGMNSDLNVSEEKGATEVQFARFAGVCRTFVPIYRQMTLGAIAAYSAGANIDSAVALAYRDVALPVAGMVAAIVLVSATVMEVRHYRQTKALDRIADQMHTAH